MSVPLAYLSVVLVWSTTPLAVKWSGEDVGFIFGVTGRMLIALVVSLMVLAVIRHRLEWSRAAIQAYIAVGLPLYVGMMGVYWGAQYVQSGVISVVFGLTPLMTAIVAVLWIKENNFTPFRIVGMLLSMAGLLVIFKDSIALGNESYLGIIGTLIAVSLHSFGTVWIKKIGLSLSAVAANTGGVAVATLLFIFTWLIFDRHIPNVVPPHAAVAIIYLAVFGTVFGAALFFYLVKKIETGKVALITVITPVIALMLGHWINHEALSYQTILGAVLVLLGVAGFNLNIHAVRQAVNYIQVRTFGTPQ